MDFRRTSGTDLPNRLVAVDPFDRLLHLIDAEIGVRSRRLSKASSVELDLLTSFRSDLEEAIRDARVADVIGNVAEAARRANRPISTVRRICKNHEAKAGASFVEGEWSIHIPTFLKFLSTMRRNSQVDGSHADDLEVAA